MRDKEVIDDMEFLTTFSSLARALQEVSIIKMQGVRDNVLKSREFHDGLIIAYQEVHASAKYNAQKTHIALSQNKKQVAVLLSADATMYGTLSEEVYALFRTFIKDAPDCDIIIIGKLGKESFEKESFTREFNYYDLEEVGKKYSELIKLINDLISYEQLEIFYGQFVSIYTQNAVQRSIPGNELKKLLEGQAEKQSVSMDQLFLLEPSTEELELFFTRQVMGLVFRQSVFEFNLARHASRVFSLEKSLDNTESQKRKMVLLFNKIKRTKDTGGTVRTMAFFNRKKHK